MTVKDLKQGEFFTKKAIDNPTESQVWIRGAYDKATKKYSITRFSDICDEQFMAGNKEVYTEFIF